MNSVSKIERELDEPIWAQTPDWQRIQSKTKEYQRAYYSQNREFNLRRAKSYRDAHKVLLNEKRKIYYENHKDIYRDWELRKHYNITIKEVDQLLDIQNHKCAICKMVLLEKYPNGRRGYRIDHDHITGNIRGILCQKCNAGLGQFNDDPILIKRVINYLKESRDKK